MKARSLLISVSMALALVPVALRPSVASAQSLHLAELFAEQGRIDDARAEVLAWFEIRGDEATPAEVQHGLWLRGRFAQDPAAGLADLDRLVEDYPDGPYTGHALGWLAAAAAEAGDEARAAALFTRVAQSHPDTEAAGTARDWLRQRGIRIEAAVEAAPPRAAPAPPREEPAPVSRPPEDRDTVPTPATRPPAQADSVVSPPAPTPPDSAPIVAESADSAAAEGSEGDSRPVFADSIPVETGDTVAPPAPPADSTPSIERPPPTEVVTPPAPAPEPALERIPPGPPVPGAATAGPFAVQIGAFRNPIGAGGLVDELITAGFDARLVQVPINDLLRVRIGRFATLEAAQAELERVRAAGHNGAVVNDARRETQVR